MFVWGARKKLKSVFLLLPLFTGPLNAGTPLEDLFEAAKSADIPRLRELKKNFTSGELKDANGDTLLQVAVKHNQLSVVLYLVAQGYVTSINSVDSEGYTPLTRAIRNKQTEIAKALLQKLPTQNKPDEIQLSADPNLIDGNKNYPITLAVELKQSEIFYAMAIAADFQLKANVRDPEGYTPLTRAVRSVYRDLVYSITNSSDVDLKFTDSSGKTAYDYAKALNNREIIALVKPPTEDPNSRDALPKVGAAPAAPQASPVPPPSNVATKGARVQINNMMEVRIPYGTNRAKSGDDTPNEFYGEDEGPLEYGEAVVTVPYSHVKGVMEGPWIFGREDPNSHIVLKSVDVKTKEVIYSTIAERLAAGRAAAAAGRSDADDVFLFVHGFNTAFPYALRKTAQLYVDLEFKGVPMTYSWPSHSVTGIPMPWNFKRDTEYVDKSVDAFSKFIEDLRSKVDRNSGQCIHVVAHSLGNRLVTKVFAKIADAEAIRAQDPTYKTPFCEFIEAAPAIDAEKYLKEFAKKIKQVSEGVTTIAAKNDKALAVQWLAEGDDFSYPLGTNSSEGLFAVSPFAHFVDATDVSGGIFDLGHAKYSDIPEIINSIRRIIVQRERPNEMTSSFLSQIINVWFYDFQGLHKNSDLEYWLMKKIR